MLLERVRNAPKRVAFALVNAINETLKIAQRTVQHEGDDEMTVRQPGFIHREIAIVKPFASVSQQRPYGEIAVGQKKNLLLPQLLDQGGIRTPFKGKSTAVPVEARPSQAASVPEELYVKRLGFRRPKATTAATRRNRRAGVVGKVWEGLRNTYLIPGAGIFQRVAGAASRVLYVFARHVKLPKVFGFVKVVTDVAERVFPAALRREIVKALEYRR